MENIEYDYLIQDSSIDREQLDEIVDLMLETVCTSRKTIRIAGDDYPAELVKSKFMKLNSEHIRFVFDCLRENTTKVRNISSIYGLCCSMPPAPLVTTTRPLWRTIWRSRIGANQNPACRTIPVRRMKACEEKEAL